VVRARKALAGVAVMRANAVGEQAAWAVAEILVGRVAAGVLKLAASMELFRLLGRPGVFVGVIT
jgi:hypothetical protein